MSAKTFEFFINGVAMQAVDGQTVIQAARANGVEIPHFCWHEKLSVPGNCRICMVEIESDGGNWFDIACNMPVTEGMKVLTHSDVATKLRKDMMQFITLNHPVDCGICNKSGECLLQDYHYEHNGSKSMSVDAKTHATKFYQLSDRVMLDNERCIMCTRCVRFTREISMSNALAAVHRGDHALIRPAEDADFNTDAYSDNVIDICPVGALLSTELLDHARVWYLKQTPSVCPGCERGCNVTLWHRKPEWKLNALDAHLNTRIDRVTPRDNPQVNGPWVCNKARDLAKLFERPRAEQAMLHGVPVTLESAIEKAAALVTGAQHAVALVSSWASNEELAAFRDACGTALGSRITAWVKADHHPAPGEIVEDDLLIKADKNPNRAGALQHFAAMPSNAAQAFPAGTDLVLVWGEGVDSAQLPHGVPVIRMDAYQHADNARADVFLPISIQTERDGSYTNCEGTVSTFQACFPPKASVAHAESLFVGGVFAGSGRMPALEGASFGASVGATA